MSNKFYNRKGEPSRNENVNGDMQVRTSNGKVRLFAKHNNKWYSTPLSIASSREHRGDMRFQSDVFVGKDLKITGDLTVGDDITMNGDVFQMGSGHNYIYGNTSVDYDITMKTYGQINLIPISQRRVDILTSDASGSGEATLRHSFNGSSHYIFDGADDGDYLKLSVAANGVSTIMTNDNAGEAANLTINPDGDLIFKPEGEQIYYQNDNGNNAALWSLLDGAATTLIFYETGGASTDDYFQIMTIGNGATTISTVDAAGTDANLSIQPDGSFGVIAATTASLAANNGDITIDASTGIYKFKLDGDADDLCTLTVAANGATTLATADSDGTAGHLTLAPNGDLVLDPDSNKIIINATDDLYLDGGGDTYITESSADVLQFRVGNDLIMQMSENGDSGNSVMFKSACVGFSQIAETFSDDSILSTGGTDDTHIDFRHRNKVFLAVTGAITNLNLIFPNVSGNFQLVLTYDGDHTITNYKVYESDESAADGNADVFWPGGTKPDNTASGVDILSFYWDASNEKCYGVGSLAFATP